jgi:hypothetical protein
MREASTRHRRWNVHVELSGAGHQSLGVGDGPNVLRLMAAALPPIPAIPAKAWLSLTSSRGARSAYGGPECLIPLP